MRVQRLSEEPTVASQETDYSNLSPWMQQAFDRINGFSVVNQINQSISGRPRYATVEDAVKDMRERTGLDKFLNEKTSSERKADGTLTRSAQLSIINEINVPDVIKNNSDADNIITFVRNRVDSTNGAVKIPELQHELFNTFQSLSANDVEDTNVIDWINGLITEAQANHTYDSKDYSGLGKLDLTNETPNDEMFQNMK